MKCPILDTLLDFFVYSFDDWDAPVGKECHRNPFIFLSFSLRCKELKVGREHRVKVFNEFTNAWFCWFWQVNKYYDYADIGKRKLYIFWFFVLPFFQKKHKIKQIKVGIKTTFLFMMKIRKEKALNKFTFVSGGTKGFFFWKTENNTQIYYSNKRVVEKNDNSDPSTTTHSKCWH